VNDFWVSRSTRCFAAFASVALLLLVKPGTGLAQDSSLEPCRALAGTYVTTITDIENVFASRGLITFTADGSFIVNDSGQGGTPGIFLPFSLGQGAWKCAAGGDGKVKADAISLTFVLPGTGQPPSFGRVDYQAELDRKTQDISGTITLSFTREGDLEGADPIKNPGPAFEKFQFFGQRVVVP